VLSGRLKAVSVATLATIVLVGVLGPATTLASDPPGLARFMYAMGQVESGGNYYARNPYTGAYGKYQIMPSNWPSWASRYLGNANARQTPTNQEIVAAGKFRSLYSGLQSWRRVAYWWLTGSSRTTGWSTYATRYVSRVMDIYRATTVAPPTAGGAARIRPGHLGPQLLRDELEDHLQRQPGGSQASRATPVVRPSTRRRRAPPRRSRSAARRSSGTARSGRPAARPGSWSMGPTWRP